MVLALLHIPGDDDDDNDDVDDGCVGGYHILSVCGIWIVHDAPQLHVGEIVGCASITIHLPSVG
jgi:hypothetical protein